MSRVALIGSQLRVTLLKKIFDKLLLLADMTMYSSFFFMMHFIESTAVITVLLH